MYSGEKIELKELNNHDIDHIHPQSLVKDNSFTNMVLVKRNLNAIKSDKYPLNAALDIPQKAKTLWYVLKKHGFMNNEKYNRLTRNHPFTVGELEGFIARQLVETRQSTKAIAIILKELYPKTEIVYVKAGNVSDFRHDVNDFEKGSVIPTDLKNQRILDNRLIKCRIVNDMHHAKDAYLNIIVGNVYSTKFTKNPRNFIENSYGERRSYSLNQMYREEVNGTVNGKKVNVWTPTKLDVETGELIEGTMATVQKYMRRNNVIVTRMAYEQKGQLFDLTLMKKGKGQVSIKKDGAISSIEKYGGYNKESGAYFFVVEHTEKNKRVRTIEPVMVKDAGNIKNAQDLKDYAEKYLGVVDAKIIAPKIKIDSQLEIGNGRVFVKGRTGTRLVLVNAKSIILDIELYNYCKKIEKAEDKEYAIKDLSEANNLRLWDVLCSKMQDKFYKDLPGADSKYEKMLTLSEDFKKLTIKEQGNVLCEFMHFFDQSAASGNMKLLKASVALGRILLSKNITGKKIYVLNQSITGLFETKQQIGGL